MSYALLVVVAIILCCVRYFLPKRSILLINIALSLVAIFDLMQSSGVHNAGVYFGVLAIVGSSLQILGMGIPVSFRWGISFFIAALALFFFHDAGSPLLLLSFIIARFAESTNDIAKLRFGLLITHLLCLQYGYMHDSQLIMLTQILQIGGIVTITLIDRRRKLVAAA